MKKTLYFMTITAVFFLAACAGMTPTNGFQTDNMGLEKVSFPIKNETLVGYLYSPARVQHQKKLPAVIIGGSWTTVKEQMAQTYAEKMAQKGFMTLVFDYRGFGESTGMPRNYENPDLKAEDLQGALDFLETHPRVDGSRIFGLGICASAGYLAKVAAADDRFNAIAMVAPWLHDKEAVEMIYGGKTGVAEKIARARQAKENYKKTGQVEYVPAISTTDKDAAMYGNWDYYLNPERGAIPQWPNQFAVMSWEGWLTFDPLSLGTRIVAPTMIVHSEKAALPHKTKTFYDSLAGVKQIHWTQGSQFDFYDNETIVSESVGTVADFFNQQTGANRVSRKNKRVVNQFFRALETADFSSYHHILHPDVVQKMPYAPGAFPRQWQGRDQIIAQYSGLPGMFSDMKFPRQIIATSNANLILVRFQGDIKIKAGGTYRNDYIGLFTLKEGQIIHYVEYFDPVRVSKAFNVPLE